MDKKDIIFSINGSTSHCGVDEYTILLGKIYKEKYQFFHIVYEDSDIIKILIKNNSAFLPLNRNPLKTITSIIKYCKIYRPKVIFIHTARQYYIASFIHRLIKTKIIIVRHNSFRLNFFPNFFFLKDAFKIVAPSFFCANVIKKQFPYFIKKIEVIYNSTKIEEYPTVDIENNQEEDKKKINLNEINIGFLGRITKEKGLDLLIDAIAFLNGDTEKNKRWNLVVAGNFENSEYEKFIREKIVQKNLVERINFKGFIKDKKEFFDSIDMLVVPSLKSWRETFGLVALESFTHNKPVVALASGALPEILGFGPSGSICFLQEPESLANTILNLYDSNLKNRYLFNSRIFLNSIAGFTQFRQNYLSLIDIY